MQTGSKVYRVSQLAKIAGVSVRTLHHYDQIGLLTPSNHTSAGYRLYGEHDLLRLQQILFFKELDFPLKEIKEILDDPSFDPLEALEGHRNLLVKRAKRLERLMMTIDKTIGMLLEGNMNLSDEELYEGFTQEQIERYKREVREMYDPKLVAVSERQVRKMSKAQWEAVKQEGGDVTAAIAGLADLEPGDPRVQVLIARHHAWIENFYPASADVYRGLGELYTVNDEFREFYEKYRSGLADFMAAAMAYYADHTLDT
jgi:DNA-binding transcriptional MerR regulator